MVNFVLRILMVNSDYLSPVPFALLFVHVVVQWVWGLKEGKWNRIQMMMMMMRRTRKKQRMDVDLANGSEVIYFSRIIKIEESWKLFDYLHNQIPGNRPNEKLYGSTLEIASVSFGCERGFLLKIKQVNHPKIEELMMSLRASVWKRKATWINTYSH